MKTIIKIHNRKFNKYGVRKYAVVPSMTEGRKTYTVGKVRKRNNNYKYVCECPDFFFRQKTCKHIVLFKSLERRT